MTRHCYLWVFEAAEGRLRRLPVGRRRKIFTISCLKTSEIIKKTAILAFVTKNCFFGDPFFLAAFPLRKWGRKFSMVFWVPKKKLAKIRSTWPFIDDGRG